MGEREGTPRRTIGLTVLVGVALVGFFAVLEGRNLLHDQRLVRFEGRERGFAGRGARGGFPDRDDPPIVGWAVPAHRGGSEGTAEVLKREGRKGRDV